MIRWALAMTIVGLAATGARGYPVGRAVALDELARTADLVCKATVVADRVVTDAWFDATDGFEVRETEFRIVSVIKGKPATKVRFRHYTPAPTQVGIGYAPQSYTFKPGRTYVVFAANGRGGSYRQVSKDHTLKIDQGVVLAADAKPHRGKTASEAVLAELRATLASTNVDDVVEAIEQLDEMSGGRMTELKDFERKATLDLIRPLVLDSRTDVAITAIEVFGGDSPYFDDTQAAYWLAGIGKSTIPGLSPRKPGKNPAADSAVKELISVANGSNKDLRALAIRALGRSNAVPIATVEGWSRDPDPGVRRAAVLVSSELADRKLIANGMKDGSPEVRHAAALAIGFTQDPKLVSLLGTLLKDTSGKVRAAAAMSLLSFAIDQAGPVMKLHIGSDYRPLFVNALARRDPKPYLAALGEVIEKRLQPSDWWGGSIPAGDSWRILFDYVKAQPATELTTGKLDRSLDSLERMQWYSSSEPRNLYALYLVRNMNARAKLFRDAVRKTVTYNIDTYFDVADKNPTQFVQP